GGDVGGRLAVWAAVGEGLHGAATPPATVAPSAQRSDARTRPDAECRIRHGCRVQPRAATGLGARHGPCLGARMHAPANAGDEALRVGAALRPSFSLGEADVLAF